MSIPDAWPVMRSQVATGKPTWDVVDVATNFCLRGGEQGIVEKLDFSKLPNAAAMPADYRSDYSIVYETYSTVLGYSTAKFAKAEAAPQSWADFWDVKKFPGRRSLRNHPLATLEIALMADGVPADKLYPLDVDRAFKKLEEIKPHITVWWTSGAQSAQLLNDGEVDMIQAWKRTHQRDHEGRRQGQLHLQSGHPAAHLAVHAEGRPEPRRRPTNSSTKPSDPTLQANLPLHIRLRPGQPQGLRDQRHPRRAREGTAERAGERKDPGADVLCLVDLAGRRSRRKALGFVHPEVTA